VTQRVYTTGQIAKMLSMAPRTISRFIDDGKLKGFQIPGSNHRRVAHNDLITFCKEFKIPESLIDASEFSLPE
jgi:two-component system response regulator RpaA